jgi:nitrate/nitrite transporter NarK
LNAAGGNLGAAVAQFAVPIMITFTRERPQAADLTEEVESRQLDAG